MKKFLTLLILFLYMTSMAGVSVEVHYCKGKLKSIHFLSLGNHSCCCKKKTAMSKSCCRNEVKFFKVLETHEIQVALNVTHTPNWHTLPLRLLSSLTFPVLTDDQKFFFPAEPRSCGSALFLSNGILRL